MGAMNKKSPTCLRPSGAAIAHSRSAGRKDARPGAQPAGRHRLYRPFHRAGVHLDLPGDRAARLRPSRHRLCAGQMAYRIEVAQTLPRQLSQPRRIPRGLHGAHRQGPCRRRSSLAGSESAAIGFRAAESRSTCSGKAAGCRKAYGCPTKASRPIAGAGRANIVLIAQQRCRRLSVRGEQQGAVSDGNGMRRNPLESHETRMEMACPSVASTPPGLSGAGRAWA